jgi:hypothetical protein
MSFRNVTGLLAAAAATTALVAACTAGTSAPGDESFARTQQASTTSRPYLTAKTPSQFLGLDNTTAQAETRTYYQTWNAPATLTAFQQTFGYNTAGADIAGAVYYNAHELGIGRIMRCVAQPSGVRACYVDNYGTFGGDSATALNQAARRQGLLATVAMVFDPSKGAQAVNYVAYDKDGNQALFAKLDTVGINPAIPFNCTNCHGGSYDPTSHTVSGSRFLAFDLDTFEYANFQGYHRQDQENDFRKLNAHAYAIAQSQGNTPMVQTIDGWYGGPGRVNTPGATFAGTFVPPGWGAGAQTDMYREVIAPYCRSCHLANAPDLNQASTVLPQGGSPTSLPIQDLCNNFNMPLAERPMTLFWNDPNAHLKILDATSQVCNTPPTYVTIGNPNPNPPNPNPPNPNPTCTTNEYGDGNCYGSPQWQSWAADQCQKQGEHLGHWQLSEPCGGNRYRHGQYACCP